MLKVYNTLKRKKEIFKAIHKKKVGMYSCGPTVYSYQHIGNLRTYLFSDVLKRVLKYDGYDVRHVMNVTDVGHLTSDADHGEDKIEKAAEREGKSAKEISNFYLKIFKEDLKKLDIISPDFWPKATENIKEQIELIKKLEEKGYTYKTSDGIYFDSSKVKNYGKLAGLKKKKLHPGKRVKVGEKKNKTDFALWKFSEKPGIRQQEWDSPWGIGFPGWHIECSAMSMKYLGENFDIHTGGMDHIPIHHSNEIAQSESATGKKFVNYWMHGAFLTFKEKKISKSKGGLYRISELEELGFSPLEYRYFSLTTNYRKPLEFSINHLRVAQKSYGRLKNIISNIKDKGINKKYLKDFENSINDDLDMPKSLRILWKLVRDDNAKGKKDTIKKMDEIFGLDLLKSEKIDVPEKINILIREREKLRKEKSWEKADSVRKKINKLGFIIEDVKGGTLVREKVMWHLK